MLKLFKSSLLSLLFMFVFISSASAAVVTVDMNGKVFWNVLPAYDEIGSSPEPESLTVKDVAINSTFSGKSVISLKNSEGKIELLVNDGNNVKQADVTNYSDRIVEVEQREAPKSISISASGNGFLLQEQNVSAFTAYPIIVEPEQKNIVLETSVGKQYLKTLPSEVLVRVVQSNILDVVDNDYLLISEGELGQVQYTVHGKKSLEILNLFTYEVPVSANVSASDGSVISVEQPIWLPVASFLFS